jgi:hypothetical protein
MASRDGASNGPTAKHALCTCRAAQHSTAQDAPVWGVMVGLLQSDSLENPENPAETVTFNANYANPPVCAGCTFYGAGSPLLDIHVYLFLARFLPTDARIG